MIIWWVFGCFMWDEHPWNRLKPVVAFTSDHDFDRDEMLSWPQDAVFSNDYLFVAPGENKVLVFSRKDLKLVNIIGRKGRGPGEFHHTPGSLEIENNQLVVTENFGWTRQWFTFDGQFVRKENITKEDKRFIPVGTRRYQRLTPGEAMKKGWRLQDKDRNAYLGRLAGDASKDFHAVERFQIHEDVSGRVLFVAGGGAVQVYGADHRYSKTTWLSVEHLKKDVVFDELRTRLMAKVQGLDDRLYRFGTPVYRSTLGPDGKLWLLIQDEHFEHKERRPTRVWLYRFDWDRERVEMKALLPDAVQHLRFTDNHLVLVSPVDVSIRIYDLDRLFEVYP